MRDPNESLRALLERGDPAGDGRDPGPDEISRLRRLVLSEGDARARRMPRLAWAAAWAAAALLSGVLVLAPGARRRDAAPSDARADLAPTRQIHFQTPGGTRLIWVLRPAEGS